MAIDNISDLPTLTFPEKEAEYLLSAYKRAKVILEYGSGGSTILAAQMSDKYIISVESDNAWAISLQKEIDELKTQSSAHIYHVDIGPTAKWGRPVDETTWRKFHLYPTLVWAQPFFREPDVVLIDGRLRSACFVATCLRIKKPTTILFDDYLDRKLYHVVEKLSTPVRMHGRMAEFYIEPVHNRIENHDLFNFLLGDIACASHKTFPYLPHNLNELSA